MLQPWMIPADLAPGDRKSALRDWTGYELHRISSPEDPFFQMAFQPLWEEFHASNEMEQPEVLARRMRWKAAGSPDEVTLFYELLLVTKDREFVGVRDHTVIVDPAVHVAVVHMSHNLVAPAHRRSGIAGWLRALPVQSARACLAARQLPQEFPIYLVAEMEPADPHDPARTTRLLAYEKAGYLKIDPAAVNYEQPDFRSPAEIDSSGGPQLVPLDLLVRKVGREHETSIRMGTVRAIASNLYRLYAREFRPQDMEPVWANLERFPSGDGKIALRPPTFA